MTPQTAETIALKALGHLAESPDEFGRFLAGAGLDPGQLRQRAAEPEFLAAVMDFYLANESLLTAFAQAQSLDPRTLTLVRRALPGG